MKEDYIQKIIVPAILIVLVVLTFLLVKPILFAVLSGFFLAFIFSPVYDWVYKKTKMKNFAAGLICTLLILLILLPLWFLIPVLIDQAFKIYLASQQMDFITPIQNIFPSLFTYESFSTEIGTILQTFTSKITNSLMNLLSNLVLSFPTILLQSAVALFIFFFVLRDKEQLISYIKSLSPFSKDVEKKLFESSKAITKSVLYGQVIIGLLQGVIMGIGFFLFGIPNALFLTVLASIAGIFPIIGTAIIWLPVAVYLLIIGDTFALVGIVIIGIISSNVDNILRPVFVSKRTKIHSALVLVGMIGGVFLFGILGFILGPLIIAYLLVLLEIYRNKKGPDIFIKEK